MEFAIVVARRSWFEISLCGKLGKAEKKKKEQRKKAREMVSKQPSSTAEIR